MAAPVAVAAAGLVFSSTQLISRLVATSIASDDAAASQSVEPEKPNQTHNALILNRKGAPCARLRILLSKLRTGKDDSAPVTGICSIAGLFY